MIITIPTCRTRAEIAPFLCDVEGWCYPTPVFASCLPASAAINRNACLDWAVDQENNEIVVMVDDDIRGFYEGWADALAATLVKDVSVLAVSARLMSPAGDYGPMMGMEGKENMGRVEVPFMPTACFAFRMEEAERFNEEFKGSGYEDSYWCHCMKRAHPSRTFLVDCNVRLVHKNEKKGQDVNSEFNKALYERLVRND